MKNRSRWDIISGVLLFVQFVVEAVVCILLGKLGVLPAGLFVAFIAVLALVLAVTVLLMWKRAKGAREQAKIATGRLIGWIVSIVMIIVCAIGIFVLGKAYSTMSAVTNNSSDNAVIGIYVLKDNEAQSLQDAGDFSFGVTDSYDVDNTRQAIDALENYFSKSISTENFGTVFAMIDALYAGEVDAIILNRAYLSVMEGIGVYQDFEEKTRVLADHIVDMPPVAPTPEPSGAPTWYERPQSAEDPFVIYLGASDTRNYMLANSRNDVNILAIVNPKTAQILLVNTPRDYYIPNPAGDGALDKLTHCGIHGVECSMEALSELYGVPVHYNAQINFSGFCRLIDAFGGVTIHSDMAFRTADGYWINVGENYMNGAVALSYARERYALGTAGDNERGNNQMKLIAALVDKLSAGTIISNYSQIMDSMKGMFSTNMTMEEIMQLVQFQLSDKPQWNLLSYAVTGAHGKGETYSAPGLNLYVMIPDEDTVDHASDLMIRVLNGEILTADDVAPKN